ncbi:MAG: tRNA (N6-isopentenyl adenosine(37)-C2)-methylthiotransferase MiaB [Acidobacteria bacterium]|nr:tRNA (N6-isopentenyl adenosine(37)-C2)-methylthiotransferase MiaB [Acidobacteriota bacterium]
MTQGAPKIPQTFYIETFGCQMNVHDSEKVAGLLLGRGYRPAGSAEEADLVLLNTCSIREKAEQKVFSRLGQLKRAAQAGKKVIGVLGCMAQLQGEKVFDQAPYVSLVCGSASYRHLPELLVQIDHGDRATGLAYDDEAFETEFTRRNNPFRAYITIIEGCDKACAYCVVPFTRGPERSRASDSILKEVRQLADSGTTEVQLLGQNVNSYCDPSPRRMSFAELLLAAGQVPGIRRVRFTTSHPRDFSADIVAAIDTQPTLCEHVHLPVQSGSTRVLRRMQREYTREEYLERIALIHKARRAISITTDIIVGFPGETEKDFEETLTLLDEVGYDGTFSFKYSPRPNTPALQLGDQVPEEEKGRRLMVLQARQRQIQQARNEALVGQTFDVLVEAHNPRQNQYMGRLGTNRVANFEATDVELGSYRHVRIERAGPNSLVGELVDEQRVFGA